MSKLYKTHFDDELMNSNNDKYSLKWLKIQLYEALMNIGFANMLLSARRKMKMRNNLKIRRAVFQIYSF